MDYFINSHYKEINIEDVLKMESFKPFQKVLVKDTEDSNWIAGIFSHKEKDTKFPYIVNGTGHVYCIPYEGNEELLGTNICR